MLRVGRFEMNIGLATVGASEILAGFSSDLPSGSIPESVRQRMKEALLDFVGNSAFAARFAESTPAFRSAVIAAYPEAGAFTVVGEARGYSGLAATLLNGAYAHSLDFDDTNLAASLHPGAVIIPAALSLAERSNCSGLDFLNALCIGYEVGCRIGMALGVSAYDRGFHVTPVAGIFGAAAAAGRLRRLGRDGISAAFGIAGSRASGSMQFLDNGAWNKRLHAGFAAHDALVSLELAAAGVHASAAPLEGRYGLLRSYSERPDPDELTAGLGTQWVAAETAFKPYPSCRLTHGAIDAALALRAHLQDPGVLHGDCRIEIALSPKAYQIVGEPLPNKRAPRSDVDGQFSVYFQVAAALLSGRCDWSIYECLGHPEVEQLADRIDVKTDATIPIAGARLRLRSSEDEQVIVVSEPLGEPGNPLGWQGVQRKFFGLAQGVYSAETSRRIASEIERFEEVEEVANFVKSLREGCVRDEP